MPAPYLRALIQRSWWRIALCALFVGAGVLAASYLLFPVYSSTAYVQVEIHTTNSVFVADRIGHNEALLATSPGILAYAAKRNPPLTAARLKSKVSVILEPNSHLIGITVQDNNAARAASVANDIATALVADQAATAQSANLTAQQPTQKLITATQTQITQVQGQLNSLGTPPSNPTQAASLQAQLKALQTQLTQEQLALQQLRIAQGSSTILLAIAEKALPAAAPLTTRIVEAAAAGVAGGAVLGLALMLALDWLNWRVRSAAQVQALLGAEPLCETSRDAIAEHDERVTEATYNNLLGVYQALGRAIAFANVDKPVRTVALVSPERTSASQGLASGLAIFLASGGRRTLLVDGYLVTGRQGRQFGVPNAPGLSDAALAARPGAEAAPEPISLARQPTTIPAQTLLVLPGGTPPPNADRVLASQAMSRTLTQLRESGADMVVFDSPPLLGRVGLTAGAKTFLKHVDGVLIVVDLDRTRKDHLLMAQTLLAEAETPVLGCVVVGSAETTQSAPRAQVAMSAPSVPPLDAPLDVATTRRVRWPAETPPGQRAAPSGAAFTGGPRESPADASDDGATPHGEQETTLRVGRPRSPRGTRGAR